MEEASAHVPQAQPDPSAYTFSTEPSSSEPAVLTELSNPEEAAAPVSLPPPPVKRHRGGPPKNEPAAGTGDEGGEKKRKRKSRWETDETAMAIVPAGDGSNRAMVAVFPKEVTLSSGLKVFLNLLISMQATQTQDLVFMKVILPASVTGEMALLDPKVRGMREELEELNRKLASNDIYIPPGKIVKYHISLKQTSGCVIKQMP